MMATMKRAIISTETGESSTTSVQTTARRRLFPRSSTGGVRSAFFIDFHGHPSPLWSRVFSTAVFILKPEVTLAVLVDPSSLWTCDRASGRSSGVGRLRCDKQYWVCCILDHCQCRMSGKLHPLKLTNSGLRASRDCRTLALFVNYTYISFGILTLSCVNCTNR